MALAGARESYFVTWTPHGPPAIEKIAFDADHWAELERNAIIFFKIHIVRVLLKMRDGFYCPACNKVCLEGDEIENTNEHSIECSLCLLWYHWPCAFINENSSGKEWICKGCLSIALPPDIDNILMKVDYAIEEHKNLENRRDAAMQLAEAAPKIPIYLDLMDDDACQQFGALPERLYILEHGKVAYQGGFSPFLYNVQEVVDWLTDWKQKEK
eukprot:gene10150-11185_t